MTNVSKNLPLNRFTTVEIENWLVTYMSELLDVEPNKIDRTIPFEDYGIDSTGALGIVGDLEEWLNLELKHTLLYKYPTVEILSKNLAAKLKS